MAHCHQDFFLKQIQDFNYEAPPMKGGRTVKRKRIKVANFIVTVHRHAGMWV